MLSMENGLVGTTIRSAADMPRSGNASDWQQRLAAQRQEAEQLAAERRQQVRDREKARQEDYLEAQQRAAEEQTAVVQEQVKSLEEVLTSVLPLPPMSFDRLMATPQTPPFDPGPLGVADPGPDWSDFAPAEPAGLARFLRRTARRKRQTAQARSRFEAATAEHREHESQRQQALAVARAKYHQKLTEARARAAARNAYVADRQSAFARGEAESVQWFGRCVLKASRYPDGFPREYQVAYDRPARNVTVEFELPPQDVVPPVRGYRYVKARDAVEPVPRPQDEISERYERLISAIALRTLHEIFSATPANIIWAVSFTAYVSTTDQATGKPVRPHLLAVSAERSAFEDLVLAEVDPATCLARLEAETPATARDATARDATAGTPRPGTRLGRPG
jgi:restriction system protein